MASREGFDLLNKYSRQNFFSKFKGKPLPCLSKVPWKLMLSDTLTPLICRIVGHLPCKTEDGEYACIRCHHYIKVDNKVDDTQKSS